MKVLIDNGHGVDTAGKRSPDGSERVQIRKRNRRKSCIRVEETRL